MWSSFLSHAQVSAGWTDHLAPVAPGWGMWRHIGMRGAGFPVHLIEVLRQPESAAAADAEIARGEALGLGPRKPGRHPPGVAAERARVVAALTTDGDRVGAALRALARDAALREAVTWQNRAAIATGFDPLLGHEAGEPFPRGIRKKHDLIAKYLTRYCMKNDTIGFFGPMGWAWIDPTAAALQLDPGSSLVAMRDTRFEHWCIDELAARLSADARLRPWFVVRRLPLFRVEGQRVVPPMGPAIEVAPAHARALALCDGGRTARQVGAALVADRELAIADEAAAFAVLGELEAKGWIRWALEVPNVEPHPDRVLRRRLARIEDPGLRAEALAPLDELSARRDRVSASAGAPDALGHALDELNATFTAITGGPAQRRGGETYAGRTLVYEDCRRDARVTIGPELLAAIGPALGLLADSARWLTAALAERYLGMFEATFDAIRQGAPAIPLLPFHVGIARHFPFLVDRPGMYATPPLAAEVLAELQRRWATLLAIPDGARQVHRTSVELGAAARDLFAAPGPGWPTARYHAPDVMIAATSADAASRGDMLAVIGELHMGINSLESPGAFFLHPDPDELVRALETDLPRPRVAPTVPKHRATRTAVVPFASTTWELAYDASPAWRSPDQVMPIAELVIERVAGALRVRSRDGRFDVHVLELYDWMLSLQFANAFQPLPRAPHAPRVTIDRLVIRHETWRFQTADLAWIHIKDPAERYVEARRWARAHGLPDRVFFRASTERKPFFLDLTSQALLRVFCKMAAASTDVTLAEALPDAGALWLGDRDGQRYTSEFRMVMVDDRPFAPPPRLA